MAHSGKTVGANLEIQLQQILIGIVVSVYILVVEAIVYGLGRISTIDFILAARLVNAFALAIFCFFVASIHAYTPRLSQALKINTTSVYFALTRYSPSRHYDIRPIPGFIYAQLIGALISTVVNIFIFPSTASHDLTGAFRRLLENMVECSRFFEFSVEKLGRESSRGAQGVANLRKQARQLAETFGQIVGGSRYEVSIERFSQLDYHRIFLDANTLAASFSTMCLPFEIDDDFYYKLEDPQAQIKFGTMTAANRSIDSLESGVSEQQSVVSFENMKRRKGVPLDTKPLVEVAEKHRRKETREEGVANVVAPIKAQIALHRTILEILLQRTLELEHDNPSRTLFQLAARSVQNTYMSRSRGDINHSDSATTEAIETLNLDSDDDLLPVTEEDRQQLYDKLTRMSLEQIANKVEQHVKFFENTSTDCISQISPYDSYEDMASHNRNVVLLSFIGALRENSICLVKVLRTLHRIYVKRPAYAQLWLPRLSWSWLYRGRFSADIDLKPDPITDNWSLENAYGTGRVGVDELDEDEKSDISDMSDDDTEVEEEQQAVVETRSGMLTPLPINLPIRHSVTPPSGIQRQPRRRHPAEAEELYKMIDNPYARVARKMLSWLRRPKTRYAFKFTVTMMTWALWAFIRVSANFFETNNGSWGLKCIDSVFGVTIGSTFKAGFRRVLLTSIAGAWGIVTWLASNNGRDPFLPCVCCILYFVVTFYLDFYLPKWGPMAPMMVMSFSSVLFPAYFETNKADGTSLGWKHAVVNAVAVFFSIAVSTLFMPYKARTALRNRLSELLRLNSVVTQSINHMHVARAEFPAVHRNELRRVRDAVHRSRIVIVKCRGLIPSAAREPSVHERFQLTAHNLLIDKLELQLEWLLYSYFTHSQRQSEVLRRMIRLALPTREDIVGSKSVFNFVLASALHSRTRLPAYLPDLVTTRLQFVETMRPLLVDQYTKTFDVTYLCRWDVGNWHLIATQKDLCVAVRTIVGADTDRWPEEVGFMLDCLETDRLSSDNITAGTPQQQKSLKGQWYRRLPKYILRDN
ncbi:hypothetical protein COEREDRAFT_6240 [Coemansia reversa NRRL 1564]|uniref:Putative ER transporter 6TM N-terminal domain-containing protein n=1 Tax=Coemansia reversa (strain ATCC 12441 / NRRL 1564) TaxID=763665 RepID=A0A2G5BHM3_COERN|nr:hypothetical protein COEREDRAFT_6240 [Coemansia reversa NRRL 1564]|eukprot:PIA18526.1 hypothetical protein COEREDRAFT_6240 [Coemansia reversa NRRL 1564]